MESIQAEAQRWLSHISDDEAGELVSLEQDAEALYDAFYRELAFGTAGLRGIIGIGPNRMNVYTVGKATQGLANYLNAHYDSPSVAIARDSRNKGEELVRAAACVLAANGVQVHLYRDIQPTPALSFAVRDLGCSAGINMTASHNPAEYNGYKAYGADGCQISGSAAAEIQSSIDSLDFFDDVKRVEFEEGLSSGLISWIGDETIDRFIDAVAAQSVEPLEADYSGCPVSIVYTPLNGTGLPCVSRILDKVGIRDVTVVPEQAMPDGDFPTCPYPNPEFREALERGLDLCRRVHPDLLIATDPDADRVGCAVMHDDEYVLLTGNEVGVLLIDYLCQMRKKRGEDLCDKVVVTTIVSSLMPDAQALDYGFQLRRVLTGFKNIGGQIALLEDAHAVDRFMFGFEESYGYMSGAHVRDKDAINATMLIAQMTRWHKQQGRDLIQAMEMLYEQYGYYLNRTVSLTYPGSAGARKMARLMEELRTQRPDRVAGRQVEEFVDFGKQTPLPYVNQHADEDQLLPQADVLSFGLSEGVKVLVRPSGTEPKIKAYLFAKGATRADADALLDELEAAMRTLLS